MKTDTTHLEQLAKRHADDRAVVAARVSDLQQEQEALLRRRLPGIKSAVARAKESADSLTAAIAERPDAFSGKTRTITVHGLRFGMVKGRGKLVFIDADQVCRLIRKHLPEQAETLIIVTERPDRKGVARLTAAELKRIGCTLIDTGDQIVVNPVDDAVDKLVTRLLAEPAAQLED